MSAQLIPVSFRGDSLSLIDHNGEPYVAMKPVVQGMGLDWKSQHRKLSANQQRWGVVMMTIPSAGGTQEIASMPLRKLPGWMMTIQPSRVRPEIKDNIIAYQNECDDALWNYWNQGVAVNKRAANDGFTQGAIADFQMDRIQMVQAVGDVFEYSIRIAELAGLAGASARFYADATTKRVIGVSPLELMNLKSLPAVSNEDQITYTPTELGKRFGMSAQELNKLLEKAGLQTKTIPGTSPLRWKPTEKGEAHGRIVRVARKNNPAICEPALEWHETVIDELTNFARDLNQRLMPVTRG